MSENGEQPQDSSANVFTQPYLAKPIVDQAAAMMVQDMRSFLQGTEQIVTIALSRALAEVIQSDGVKGTVAIEKCKEILAFLPDFATNVGLAAASIVDDFK